MIDNLHLNEKFFINENGIMEYDKLFVNIVILVMLLNGIIRLRIEYMMILGRLLKSRDINAKNVIEHHKQNLKENMDLIVIF